MDAGRCVERSAARRNRRRETSNPVSQFRRNTIAFMLLGASGAAAIGGSINGCMTRPLANIEVDRRSGPSHVPSRVVELNGLTIRVNPLSAPLATIRTSTARAVASGSIRNGNGFLTISNGWSTNYLSFGSLSVNVAINARDGVVVFGSRSSHDFLSVELHLFSGLVSSGGRILTSFELLGESVVASDGENMTKIYALPRDQAHQVMAQWGGGQLALATILYPNSMDLRRPYDPPYVALLLDPGVPEPTGTHNE